MVSQKSSRRKAAHSESLETLKETDLIFSEILQLQETTECFNSFLTQEIEELMRGDALLAVILTIWSPSQQP
ncbi:hypothetical protein AV530_010881 [Patagioenas fasciata monilis]|uniref:Uncharacterized protein n=1 Tax=Patagioenas fasciata monilis TaxID=372326 RepID=A0A1V4K832_PATFA|nr:hypothetical protein AV530_010881 [Patagioenas fasciata monilis]